MIVALLPLVVYRQETLSCTAALADGLYDDNSEKRCSMISSTRDTEALHMIGKTGARF
ncbi:hypothetical protein [Mesorhizobium sp. L48C026A00]|uniref:hypothetical protein n=1 Tax=Mesorhizobium sp. L48C026A00 TaxID=1287182 RepID=UPI0003D0196A|nr:hypothetical protein [Mesorhizobium sp. L48C026A00]ESZ11056.1 hypothetical protein X737_30485 [Mesorhizobium sp. L48C026A00]